MFKLKLFSIPIVLILASLFLVQSTRATRPPKRLRMFKADQNNRPVRSELGGKQVYLLISTSSKLYCMRLPDMGDRSVLQNHSAFHHDLINYEIIYEERTSLTSWITDAIYVKSENLIYVNVYNSSSVSSAIFTLRHEPMSNTWHKTLLYKDQSYCLGISYNEERRELYWTAAKSILAGSSTTPGRPRTVFNLGMAKKLLYLKYDSLTETVFVSTLNYVFACSLRQSDPSDCRIIVRDLVSARGLYLDEVNRHLYVVDHKKRNIKRIRLPSNPQFDYRYERYEDESISTVLSTEIISDLGDTFYMTIFKNFLVWCEFSGKVKISWLNNTSQYGTVFATNEYTYSVNIMDNSTNFVEVTSTTTTTSTTPIAISASATVPISSANLEVVESATSSATVPVRENEAVEVIEQSLDTTEPPLVTWTRNRLFSSTPVISSAITEPITTETQPTTVTTEETTSVEPSILTEEILALTTVSVESSDRTMEVETAEETTFINLAAVSYPLSTDETTTTIESGAESETEKPLFVPKNVTSMALSQEYDEETSDARIHANQIQNLRSLNLMKSNDSSPKVQEMASSSYNIVRASPKLSVALYIVIGLLCFSLIINVVLLYVSKRKQMHREKLIIRHEICDVKSESMPSQRSGLTSKNSQSGDLNECNINLINSSNDSATSNLDIEHE